MSGQHGWLFWYAGHSIMCVVVDNNNNDEKTSSEHGAVEAWETAITNNFQLPMISKLVESWERPRESLKEVLRNS